MPPDDPVGISYAQLRKLAASDAKQARSTFCAFLVRPKEEVICVLEQASRPGEGRVRHMIAIAARLDPQTDRVVTPWLKQWLPVETDEFARSAIASALESNPRFDAPPPPVWEMPANFIEAYRYTAERLCHRIRNPLTRSASLLLRLERLTRTSTESERAELVEIHHQLRALFERLGQVVDFDVDEKHVIWQSIPLGEWLNRVSPNLATRYGPATFVVSGTPEAQHAVIRATTFLLETAFGNLWVNAVQATEQEQSCYITADFRLHKSSIEVLLSDNSLGFTSSDAEAAFRVPFSTKSASRGRGLLEVAEAVSRLHGTVQLIEINPEEYRIRIDFPKE